jgi:hypothetical protein
MARKATSIKGEVVDFDLLELKRKIGDKPVSADVKNREDFVYSKRKRGSKRAVQKMLDKTDKPVETKAAKPEPEEKPEAMKNQKRKIIKKRG